jgi:type II secretory pathway pseudopilin PulG
MPLPFKGLRFWKVEEAGDKVVYLYGPSAKQVGRLSINKHDGTIRGEGVSGMSEDASWHFFGRRAKARAEKLYAAGEYPDEIVVEEIVVKPRFSLQEGFTYLTLLIVVAITCGALAALGGVWSQAAQRDKERELLFIGDQFRQAIAYYYYRTPGAVRQYPKTLEALLEDKRYPMPQRYLRRIYADPVTGKSDWGVIEAPGGGVMGVYSRSEETPIKSAGFPARYRAFAGAEHYSDWKFVFNPDSPEGLGRAVAKATSP